MPVFTYSAINKNGNEISGRHEAADINTVSSDLRQRGLRILDIKKSRSKAGIGGQDNFSDWLASQRSVAQSSLIFFFRQMAFMLRAGLPVVQAMELAVKQVSSSRLKLVIRLMLKDITAGSTLSVAMRKHNDIFPDMAVNLVIAGENTGDLDNIMERLSLHLEKKAALRTQMINAMLYPSIVVIAAIGIGVFMVVKIIPQFAKFLLGQGKALPPSTQLLIDISDFVHLHGLMIIASTIFIITFILIFYQTRIGRLWIDNVLLRVPVIGSLLITGSMAQMTWAFSILLRSGVTVYDSLKIVSNLINNRVYSNKLKSAATGILGGKDMASSIEHKKMPPLVIQMIAVGENTGSLDHILQELGTYYEKLLENAIKRMTALIEPAMILVIAVMVGFVYYAFFQALFSLVGG